MTIRIESPKYFEINLLITAAGTAQFVGGWMKGGS
jgi:hypothetical protein